MDNATLALSVAGLSAVVGVVTAVLGYFGNKSKAPAKLVEEQANLIYEKALRPIVGN